MAGAQDSDFFRWIITQMRAVGRDPEEIDPGTGEPAWKGFVIVAAIALTSGLDERQETILAHMLGVTVDEVRSAYLPEMRENALAELLDHPDLSAMDRARE